MGNKLTGERVSFKLHNVLIIFSGGGFRCPAYFSGEGTLSSDGVDHSHHVLGICASCISFVQHVLGFIAPSDTHLGWNSEEITRSQLILPSTHTDPLVCTQAARLVKNSLVAIEPTDVDVDDPEMEEQEEFEAMEAADAEAANEADRAATPSGMPHKP